MNLRFAWIIAASAVFTVFPLGPYGLLGWLGALGPLLCDLLPSRNVSRAAAIVVAAMFVATLFADELRWIDAVVAPVILVVGMWLSRDAHAIRFRGEHNVAVDFERTMARELGRARRHERPLTLVSISPVSRDDDLQRLGAAVGGQLHLYCQVFELEGRLLVIMPELHASDVQHTLARVVDAVAQQFGPVAIGSATFPDTGVTARALIARADADRAVRPRARRSTNPAAPTNPEGTKFSHELPSP